MAAEITLTEATADHVRELFDRARLPPCCAAHHDDIVVSWGDRPAPLSRRKT
jgi:hypothetical protein